MKHTEYTIDRDRDKGPFHRCRKFSGSHARYEEKKIAVETKMETK